MTGWRPYERYLLSGLWHVHTERTDGNDSVADLVAFADASGFPLLGVVEHVRRDPTYDFDALVDEVKRRTRERDVRGVVGCEAKVLDADGTLDVSAATRRAADVVYAAFHGTSFSRGEYLRAVQAVLENPDVDVWAHPWSYAERAGYAVTREEREAILGSLREHQVLFELNLRRPTPTLVHHDELRDVPRIVGYDLHDLERWRPAGADGRPGR